MRLGIDFGTTRSVVSFCDRGNYPVVGFLDDAGDSIDWYPSVVAERGGELRFGFEALAASTDPEWTVVRSFKRYLSQPRVSPSLEVDVGTTKVSLIELLTRFLEAMKRALQTRSTLKKALKRDLKLEAIVATPANAHSAQRFLTLDAFRRAGFDVLSLLNEPSAAGFEYTHRHRNTLTSKREHVVVYDLGGGTFDASLVRMSGRTHDVAATAGDNALGGDDFDDTLVRLALAQAKVDAATLSARARDLLTDHCRESKERLGPNTRRIVIDLASTLGAESPLAEVTVVASDYYDAVAPLIERTIEVMLPVLRRSDDDPGQAVNVDDEGGLDEIAGLYVVGGASSLPPITRALRTRFGRRVHRTPYPSAATAIGLAIAGDPDADYVLSDRLSRNFGVFREARAGAEITFDTLFDRETKLPSFTGDASAPAQIEKTRIYRAAHNIGHFRYAECSHLGADGAPRGDITPFADVFFPFDPALREGEHDLARTPVTRLRGAGPLIRERYAVDVNGIVSITIADVEGEYERTYRV